MTEMTFEDLFDQVEKLSPTQRLRMMELLAASLHTDYSELPQRDWHEALKATYGILADDPIEALPR